MCEIQNEIFIDGNCPVFRIRHNVYFYKLKSAQLNGSKGGCVTVSAGSLTHTFHQTAYNDKPSFNLLFEELKLLAEGFLAPDFELLSHST